MDTKKIVTIAKVLNIVEIVMTAALFISFQVINKLAVDAYNHYDVEKYNSYVGLEQTICLIMSIASVVVIILAAVLMAMNKGQVPILALGLLLASGIVTFVFGLLGFAFGIVIWITSGMSLKQLNGVPIQY